MCTGRRPTPGALSVGLSCLAQLLLCLPIVAQDLRHEVGLRVKPFEQRWEGSSAEDKQRALPHVERAVRSFFSFNLPGVAQAFDVARLRLAGETGPARWFDSLCARPTPRVVPLGDAVVLSLEPLYSTEDTPPPTAQLLVCAAHPAQDVRTFCVALSTAGARVTLPWRLPAGDWTLTVRWQDEDTVLRKWHDVISVVPDAHARIAALSLRLQQAAQAAPATAKLATQQATAGGLLLRCQQVVDGAVPEVPFGVEAALQRAARLIDGVESGASTGLGTGDQWWVLRHETKQSTLRMWLPEALHDRTDTQAKAPPLLLAVHGVGGSENLFFEGYGAGRIVEFCRARGWILVVPRRPLIGAMPLEGVVNGLSPLIRFDSSRVYVVGHSKGVGEILDAMHRSPSTFRAAALIGGGGRVRDGHASADVPYWVAAGERDFGRAMARRTHNALTKLGATSQWHVIPHTEHMTVVADALPSVLEFFKSFELLDGKTRPGPPPQRKRRASF